MKIQAKAKWISTNLCEDLQVRTKNIRLLETLAVFALIFSWRVFVLWHGQINHALWQDEISWMRNAQAGSLLENIQLRDSGYPVPFSRLILWILSNLSPGNAGLIHTYSAFVAAGSCASIIMILGKHYSSKLLALLALIIGFFPTFDLLLFHNLSYFVYIPTISYLLDRVLVHNFTFFNGLITTLLICLCPKPQLLLSILVALFSILCVTRSRIALMVKNIALPCFTTLFFFVLGRFDQSSIDLSITLRNMFQSLTALIYIPSAILFPWISIGASGFSRMIDSSYLWWTSSIILVASNILLLNRIIGMNRIRLLGTLNGDRARHSLLIFLFLAPIYFSLFVFPNSGWEGNYFWNATCTACLYQRHWLPTIFLFVLAGITLMHKSKVFFYLLVGTLVQVSTLAVIAYPYLYFPV